MTDRDRLIELLEDTLHEWECDVQTETLSQISDHLLANGVRVIDTKVINPKNRELITHFAGMPINDVLDLVRAKKEGRLIVPPCKVGDTVYYLNTKSHMALYKNTIYEAKVVRIVTTHLGTCLVIQIRDEFGCCEIPDIRDWGKTVFLTKEKAEEKLKELGK